MKRWIALVLALCMMLATTAWAEEADGQLNQEEQKELEALDAVNDDDDDAETIAGETYREKELSDFDASSPAIYTCRVQEKSSGFSERSTKSARVFYNKNSVTADVLYVGSNWAIIRYEGQIGFIKRSRISSVKAVDPVNTAPYGVQKCTYIATTAVTCPVYKSMSTTDEDWVTLNPGTLVGLWLVQDGWAIVPYWRSYGYIKMDMLTDIIPVSPTDTPLSDETPIAAYTSYYSMAKTDINKSRLVNIRVACDRLTRVMQPGEELNFNKQVGPYRKSLGYQKAWVLINGTSVPGYGGGTCQVSSTLYNALLQLPGVEILQRRPHGPDGAKYLPHGVDAAVGSDVLNLRFRNDYDFPIRVEGHTSDDGALTMVIYRVDE